MVYLKIVLSRYEEQPKTKVAKVQMWTIVSSTVQSPYIRIPQIAAVHFFRAKKNLHLIDEEKLDFLAFFTLLCGLQRNLQVYIFLKSW